MAGPEAQIERHFAAYADKRGCKCLKLLGPPGWPDRTLLLPGGQVVFMEFKRPDGKLSRRQNFWLGALRGMGFRAVVVRSLEEAREILDLILIGPLDE